MRGLAALSGAGPAERALDVACGPGLLTLALAARCRAAVGIDATGEMLALAREEAARRGAANAAFCSGDAERLPFPSASFGVVACRAAFHHFPRPAAVLSEMARCLAPGGRALIADMVATGDPERDRARDRVERLCDPTHARTLPAAELEALLADAGLELVERRTSKLHYDLDEWIDHGGPGEAAAREIAARMEASLEGDPLGLEVRREEGRIRFSHTAVALVARRPPA
jgi:ubiquinone/menaquinone biosynthesis C-methylase UbiE